MRKCINIKVLTLTLDCGRISVRKYIAKWKYIYYRTLFWKNPTELF